MTWIIVSSLLIIVGAFAYYSSKRKLSGNGVVQNSDHNSHEHEHNHKGGHSCCH